MHNYIIVITKNKKRKKLLHKCIKESTAIKKYNTVTDNNIVLFPKRYISYNGLSDADHEILLLKKRSDGDENRIVRDSLGRIVEEKINNKDWVIVERKPYFIEEEFYVFGYKKRFTAKDIIKQFLSKSKKRDVKQLSILLNKLIIYDDDSIDIIICKNQDDVMRLYNTIEDYAYKFKLPKIVFFGELDSCNKYGIYRRLQSITGWNIKKLYRDTTRP